MTTGTEAIGTPAEQPAAPADSTMKSCALKAAIRDPRIRLPIVFSLLVMVVLSAQRLLVFLLLRDRFAGVPSLSIAHGFLIGLRFDVWVAAALAVPLVIALAAAPPKLAARRAYQFAIAVYAAVVGALLVFTCIADYYFFEEYGERLNHKALDYLGYPATYGLIWHDYPVVWALLGTVVVLAGLIWLFRRIGFPRGFDSRSVRRLIVWLVIVAPLLVIAIRGVAPMAINSAPAYFSPYLSLSQLTLDGPFTLREAIVSRTIGVKDLDTCVKLLPENEALATAARVLARPEDRFLNQPDNPLRRITDSGRPQQNYNVVLVMLESMSWPYIGALGGEPDFTPTLNDLAAQGTLMERCFAVGDRTSRAMSGIVAGFPDLPGMSVTTRNEAEGNFLTLAQVLRRRGYQTLFLYGGQPNWDHLQAFLRSNGFGRALFEDDFKSRTFRTVLGWCDEDLFNQAHREFLAMGDRPFFGMMLTLSFHRPFEIPPERLKEIEPSGGRAGERTCARYVDGAIRGFFEKARQADYFKRTIFVFVADHRGEYLGRDMTAAGYRVPFIIYAPGIPELQGRRVSTVCSQTDIAPTIMSILGGSYEHSFFGSSVLDRPNGAGVALMENGSDSAWLMAANGDAVLIPFGATPRLFRYHVPDSIEPVDPSDAAGAARCDELYHQAVALLQSATILFERGSYRLTDEK